MGADAVCRCGHAAGDHFRADGICRHGWRVRGRVRIEGCRCALFDDASVPRPLPTLEELEQILATYHGSSGTLPYVADLAAIRFASFERGREFERLNPATPSATPKEGT